MKPAPLVIAALLGACPAFAWAETPHLLAPASDTRTILHLEPQERVMILAEMRLFLAGVQKLTGALGRQDMQAAAEAARSLGRKMTHEVPPALRAKRPQAFRQLGFSVHSDFDQMAVDAESMGDVGVTLRQLSATLQTCVSCHASYQIRTSHADGGH